MGLATRPAPGQRPQNQGRADHGATRSQGQRLACHRSRADRGQPGNQASTWHAPAPQPGRSRPPGHKVNQACTSTGSAPAPEPQASAPGVPPAPAPAPGKSRAPGHQHERRTDHGGPPGHQASAWRATAAGQVTGHQHQASTWRAPQHLACPSGGGVPVGVVPVHPTTAPGERPQHRGRTDRGHQVTAWRARGECAGCTAPKKAGNQTPLQYEGRAAKQKPGMKPGMKRTPKNQNPYAATEKRPYFRFNV